MKVLQVMAGDTHGGAENFFMRLVIALSQAGLEQEVILKPHPSREKNLEDQNIPVTTASFNRTFPHGTRRKIKSTIDRFAPDIVLTWMSRASSLCPGGDFIHVGRLGGYYDLKYYKNCDYLVGNTQDIVSYLRDQEWAKRLTHYLPNFVDPPAHDKKIPRERFNTPPDVPLLLTLGRLHKDKAFDVLIKAMDQISQAHLWIAGVGDEKESLQKLAAQSSAQERIHFIGWHEDITTLYNTCDIYVCPSRIEPLGNVILEAWAHKRPVVAAKSKGPKALIQSEETGLLTDLEDWESMAIALNRLLQNPSLKKKLVQKAYESYETAFTKEKVVQEYLAFFETITLQKRF